MNSASARIIFGVSTYYHDSSAALFQDGVLGPAAQRAHFPRKKFRLAPIIFLLGALLFFAQESAIVPFIYTLFQ